MSDHRNSEDPVEPITGTDQTNGLVDGLEGDDGGAIEPTADQNVIGDAIRDLDPDAAPNEHDEGETSYSEEGQP
ncbi:hypothetical protein [Leifsonia poae]|nr:hypothetical protein [Leifsonia poae]